MHKSLRKLYLAIFTIFMVQSPFLFGQTEEIPSLPHEMTADELLRKHEIGKSFVETTPPTGTIRAIAEFEQMEGVLVRYPFGIPYPLIAEMSQHAKVWTIVANTSQKTTVTNSYNANGVNLTNCRWIIAPTESYWTRDYGPWFVRYGNHELGIVDFPYNRPRPNDDEIPKVVADSLGIDWFGMNVIHTGGNYMTTGTGISASTDLVIVENPSQSVAQINQKMLDYMGITNYYCPPDPNGTYIDHIDCWGKFLAPDKVLVRKVPSTHPQYNLIEQAASYFAQINSSYGTPFKISRVNTPSNQPYTNSVIVNNKVMVPYMNNLSTDTAALHVYQNAMPGYQVFGFIGLSGSGWQSTDALHCRVIGMADRGMLEIVHMPYTGMQAVQSLYPVNADIFAYSLDGLYPDSVQMFYKINNGVYQSAVMNSAGINAFTADIPGAPVGSIISYYLRAVDSSGKTAMHPIMGPADPHVFEIGGVGVEPAQGYFAAVASLDQNFPNPFRSETLLSYTIRSKGHVSLEIFTIDGRKVRTMMNQNQDMGNYKMLWDGNSDSGQQLGSGIYLCKLSTGGLTWIQKLVMTR